MRQLVPKLRSRRVSPGVGTVTHPPRGEKWYSRNYLAGVLARRPARILAAAFFALVVGLLIVAFAANSPESTILPLSGGSLSHTAITSGKVTLQDVDSLINPDFSPKSGAWLGSLSRPDATAPGGSPTQITTRENFIGRKYDFHMGYHPLVSSYSLSDEVWSFDVDHVPLTVLSWPEGPPATTIQDMAAGRDDSQTIALARAMKGLNGRVLFRPFWEMNGVNFRASNYGGDYSLFTKAWIRVYTIVNGDAAQWQTLGIQGTPVQATNVKFVWCPGNYLAGFGDDYRLYYPGDQYVDWIGLDHYPRPFGTKPQHSLLELFTASQDSTLDWYHTYAPKGKPMMIGETGVLAESAYPIPKYTRPTWFSDAGNALKTQLPQIKAFDYFDDLPNRSTDDWRFDAPSTAPGDSPQESIAAFKALAHDPYFNTLNQ